MSEKAVNDVNEELNIAFWPDYVLLRIFSILPIKSLAACGLTCSNWKRIAADSSLWSPYMEFDRFSKFSDISEILQVGGTNVKTIFLRLFTDFEGIFELIAEHCPQLRALELDHCPSPSGIDLESLARIADGCQDLQVLAFRNMLVDDEYMTALMLTAEQFPKLSKLVVFRCFGVTSNAIEGVVDKLTHLQHLDVEHTRLSRQSMEAIARKTGATLKVGVDLTEACK
jgi:hypothetical protein